MNDLSEAPTSNSYSLISWRYNWLKEGQQFHEDRLHKVAARSRDYFAIAFSHYILHAF